MILKKVICVGFVGLLLLTASCTNQDSHTQKQSRSKYFTSDNIAAFYSPPKLEKSDQPGTILRIKQVHSGIDEVSAWRILYVTTSIKNKPVAASAFVLAPTKPIKSDLVVWAHPSVGLADNCAPSRNENFAQNLPFFGSLIKKGYVVVAPDYEGLGTPGIHPYLIGDSEGKSILDSIRMVKNFDKVDVPGEAVIIGHSQGGHAALFAGQLLSSYAPETKVAGIVAIAPAGDLTSFFGDTKDFRNNISLVALGAVSFSETYPDLKLNSIFSAGTISKFEKVKTQCLGDLKVLSGQSDALIANPVEISEWKKRLEQNSPGNTKINVPVLLEHGLSDGTVPPEVSEQIFVALCNRGTSVTRKTYPGALANHVGVILLGQFDTMRFVNNMFAGEPVNNGCLTS